MGPSQGLEPAKERASRKRGAFLASWRVRRQAGEAGADPRSGCAESYTPNQLTLKLPAIGSIRKTVSVPAVMSAGTVLV